MTHNVSASLRVSACRKSRWVFTPSPLNPACSKRPCSRLRAYCLAQNIGPLPNCAAAIAKPLIAPISPWACSQISCTPSAPSFRGKRAPAVSGLSPRRKTPGRLWEAERICSYFVLKPKSQEREPEYSLFNYPDNMSLASAATGKKVHYQRDRRYRSSSRSGATDDTEKENGGGGGPLCRISLRFKLSKLHSIQSVKPKPMLQVGSPKLTSSQMNVG